MLALHLVNVDRGSLGSLPTGGDIKRVGLRREEAGPRAISGCYARDRAVLIRILLLEHGDLSRAAAGINPFRRGIVEHVVAVTNDRPLPDDPS